MATHTLHSRDQAVNAGLWAAIAAAWPTNAYNGDSGVFAQGAVGAGNPGNFLEISGNLLDDSVIPLTAIVNTITFSGDYAITAPASNTGQFIFGSFLTPHTYSGSASGSATYLFDLTGLGATWADVLAAGSGLFEWLFQRDAAAQAGGNMRIVVTNFAALVDYSPVSTFTAVAPIVGTTNTAVTLTGTGLSGVVQGDVLFGTTPALSVAVQSDTTVTCLAPAHAAGVVDVTITGVGTRTSAFTYIEVTRVSPPRGSVFGNEVVTITGFGFNAATGVTFDGISAIAYTIDSNTQITATTPAHNAGAVTVAVLGVGSKTAAFTYQLGGIKLPPIPVPSAVASGSGGLGGGGGSPVGSRSSGSSGSGNPPMQLDYMKWLMVVKQTVEQLPSAQVSAGQIVGVFTASQIPQLPFSRLTMDSPRLLGRTTDGTGDSEEITVNSPLSLSLGQLTLAGLPTGWTIGDLIYADTDHTFALLSDVAAGSYLRSGGVATAPLWSTLKLPNAGTVGDLPIVSSTNTVTMLPDVSAGSYLRSGGVTTAPVWSTLTLPNAANSGDILKASSANVLASVAPAALTKTDDTNVTLTLGGSATTALVNAASLTLGWTGQLVVGRGGTGLSTVASGGLLYASALDTLSVRTIGSTGDVLTVSGGFPAWAAPASVAAQVAGYVSLRVL